MKLQELLYCLSGDEEIGIFDIRYAMSEHKRKFGRYPTRQTYKKVKNLTFYELRDLLRLDVMCVNVYEGGLFIRVYDKNELETRINLRKVDENGN